MITIGSKNKILLFDVSTEGVDKKDLEFWFRIRDDDITYSFAGELQEDNKVKVTVLPLSEVINFEYLDTNKIYPACLDVISEGKYNLKTWDGDIQVEASPRVDVKLENIQDVYTEQTIPENNAKRVEPKVKAEVADIIEEHVTRKKNLNKSNNIGKKRSLLEEVLKKNEGNKSIQDKIKKLMK